MKKAVKIVRSAYEDRDNSVDLFDGSRKNEFGTMCCVAPAILENQVDRYWDLYLDYLDHLEDVTQKETNE